MQLQGDSVRSKINVTPLVDVVLVLLIIFMVITPMLQRGKPVELPNASVISEPKRGGDAIVLSITADGSVWVEKTRVEVPDLGGVLTQEMSLRRGAPIMLKGDRSLDYRIVRAVLLEVSKTRAPGVSLAATAPRTREGH